MKWLLLFVCATTLGTARPIRAATNVFFAQGVAAIQSGDFSTAAAALQNSVKRQPAVGSLVNLGIAQWQRGHAGAAILAWEQAEWIDPFDERASQNLKFARIIIQVDDPQLNWFESASTWLPPNAWVWIAGASLWVAVGALMLPGVFRMKKAGWQQTLAAFALVFFLFSVTANFGVVSRANIGFVLKKSAPLLLTPTRDGEVISTLNAGEPGRRLRTRGSYYYISSASGAGWMDTNDFGLINPD